MIKEHQVIIVDTYLGLVFVNGLWNKLNLLHYLLVSLIPQTVENLLLLIDRLTLTHICLN